MKRTDVRYAHLELDRLARKLGWAPGYFRSWETPDGWMVSVGARGVPRGFVARRDNDRHEFASLDRLLRFLRSSTSLPRSR